MTREQLIKNGMKYQFTNEVRDNKHILTLSGVVAKPDWIDRMLEIKTINAEDIAKELDDVDMDIHIKLNSGGGDAFEGIEIYNYLKNHPSHVTIEVTALAASAASIISMGADDIVMNTGTSMMIHQASTIAWGDKTDLNKAINALETIDGSLVDIYEEQTGLSKEELDDLLVKESWFTADEAVEKGFANRKSSKRAEPLEGGGNEPSSTEGVDASTMQQMFDDFRKEMLNEFQQSQQPINPEPNNQDPKPAQRNVSSLFLNLNNKSNK
ncbi:head maturation protease, ClpP-related [Salimicrobium album]|uniref:ATP-dependent Clp protease proteolytic subunit n=1 Tax=Salimicrobium album TaxID=50717 RepID=A0A1H3DF37_9BACI|nr:head maturation protease, ClpP-related [Salimicrobium album]SDX65006.1 ATP-dependent protease ClpP, protease subunit [Salimicrobium album]